MKQWQGLWAFVLFFGIALQALAEVPETGLDRDKALSDAQSEWVREEGLKWTYLWGAMAIGLGVTTTFSALDALKREDDFADLRERSKREVVHGQQLLDLKDKADNAARLTNVFLSLWIVSVIGTGLSYGYESGQIHWKPWLMQDNTWYWGGICTWHF